jgi:hypothetical protein
MRDSLMGYLIKYKLKLDLKTINFINEILHGLIRLHENYFIRSNL